MIVTCENCQTGFNLDERLLKAEGSKVRCSKCKHVFTAYPPTSEPKEEALTDESGQDTGPPPSPPSTLPEEPTATDASTVGGEENETDGSSVAEETIDEDFEDDMDLSDIEKMLSMEDLDEEGSESATEALLDQEDMSAEEDSLDLSDIEKMLDEADDEEPLDLEDEEDEPELELDLDEEIELEASGLQEDIPSEIDLGDLDKMFEEEEESPPAELEDLELDFEGDDSETEDVVADAADEADVTEDMSDLENLELELNFDEEAPEEASQTSEPEELELDLSLDEEEPSEAAEDSDTASEPEELELDLSLDEEEPSDATEDSEAASEPEELELDLSLDEEEPAEAAEDSEQAPETEELELDLMMEGSAVSDEVLGEDALSPEDIDAEEAEDFEDDMDLDFPDDAVPEIPDDDEAFLEETEPAEGEEEILEEDISLQQTTVPQKDGPKVLLILLIVLFILLLGGGGALVLLKSKGIDVPFLKNVQIPFLDKMVPTKTPDPGNLQISTSNVNSQFVENEKTGKLFVITGEVQNDYKDHRSFIKITAKLFSQGKVLSKTETIYSGNVISGLELSTMDLLDIKKKLGNREGDNKANVKIPPGQKRPFMVVFSDLPDELEEFTVEVTSSSPAS